MAKVKCPRCFYVNPDGQETCVKCKTALPKIKIEAAPPPAATNSSQDDIQLRRGQVLANRYTVLNLIGRGGMGCIYKVHDNVLGEDVALKTLLPQFVQDRLVLERFFNEARIARRLTHANIVRVHDIGSTAGVVYISMELLKGKSLRSVMESLPPNQRLPVTEVLRIMDELCAALEYAHQYTIHRDIKPENIMIGLDGAIKLMDFGISKLMANTRLTGASVVMGTPYYMPPEQVRNSRDVNASSDIYSAGVVLYEILTGYVPSGVPKPASELFQDVPKVLDAIVAKCVDPDPAKRYQSAAELRAALGPLRERLEGKVSGQATPKLASRPSPPPQPARRRMKGIAAVLGVLAVMGAGLFGAELRRQHLLAAPPPGVVAGDSSAAFKAMQHAIARIRPRAEIKAQASKEHKRCFEDAEKRWDAAQMEARSNGAQAAALAEQALQHYLAAILMKENMVFVPSGQVILNGAPVQVAGFLIDTREVTLEEFARFCKSVPDGWPFPSALEEHLNLQPRLPVSMVAFYDAQAYAAWAGKMLPTEAQWARAAYGGSGASPKFPWGDAWEEDACNCQGETDYAVLAPAGSYEKDITWSGCYDMAGNVAEWTRTPAAGAQEPGFGAPMAVRGGHYRSQKIPLDATDTAVYESKHLHHVGFRCVIELPTDPGAALAFLEYAS